MSDELDILDDIRSYILNQPLKMEPVATPYWPRYDGKLAFQDVPTAEVGILQKSVRGKDGKPDDVLLGAALLIRALVHRDSGKQIFSPKDRDSVAALGTTILAPLMRECSKFLKLDPASLDDAKKNLPAIQNDASSSSSQADLAAPSPNSPEE